MESLWAQTFQAQAQARWRLTHTHLLPADDPDIVAGLPASVAVGGVRCDDGFERWQEVMARRQVSGSALRVTAVADQTGVLENL
ncbi:MAG: hypothetical protein ACRD0J_11110 [Acidimicrobiales bacterium]